MTKEEAITREEAIRRIKAWNLDSDDMEVLSVAIPELAESEDERIRKELMLFLSDIKRISESGRTTWAVRKEDAMLCNAALAYLEKQKEQKPIEWNGPKEFISNTISKRLQSLHLQPKQEWSEADKTVMLNTIIADVNRTLHSCGIGTVEHHIRSEAIKFLKSFRPSWKPTEKQMKALKKAVKKLYNSDVADSVRLSIMYDNLKKLI